MYKYLFFIFFMIVIWGCDTPDDPNKPECNADNPCGTGYVCEDNKCVLDTPITDCTAGETKSCYTGGSATKNVGTCKDGVITCTAAGKWDYICRGEVKPTNEVCGDNLDNNCNSQVDEDCGCGVAGDTRSCYTGTQGTSGKGICKSGTETCLDNLTWSGQCVGEVLPITETCQDVDNDCNGTVDSSEPRCDTTTECNPGDRKECHTTGNNVGVGICKSGYNLCDGNGNWGTECLNEIKAEATDSCTDGVDNNCNGIINENCDCTPGEEKSCYTGNPDELGKGICESGTIICASNGKWNTECQGEEKPVAEACDNIDNDCDGIIDNGVANACGSCGTLPTEVCNNIDDDCDGIIDNVTPANGGNACGGCGDVPTEVCGNGIDEDCDNIIDNPSVCDVTPECIKTSDTDICDNGLDDDCDGSVDNGSCDRCGSLPQDQQTIECFTGSPSAVIGSDSNPSICRKGTSSCVGGESWGVCQNDILPQTEVCNGLDDDCDGTVDNTFNVGQPCYVGVGECRMAGVYSCNNQGGVTCIDGSGNPLVAGNPTAEKCDGLDNNCNGSIDETFSLNQGCYSGLGECQTIGQTICSTNKLDVVCNATPTSGTTELCGDGLDNDCNGLVDDVANLGLACENGVGACKRTGSYECDTMNHTVKCNAIAGQASSEICGDNIDNDCDNITDTDPELNLNTSCTIGQGICERVGGFVCRENAVVCDGTPGNADGRGEICNNGLDDDCDGTVDEQPCLSLLSVTCPAPPMVRPVNPPDGYGRAFTRVNYSFTPTINGSTGGTTYKWELTAAPDSNGQTPNNPNSLTTTFEPHLISARQSGDPQPYVLKFTATEGSNTASCNVQFYAVSQDFIHVELTWGNATDMDLHMLVPTAGSGTHSNWEVSGDSGSYDCGYANCDDGDGLEWNGANTEDNPHLDIDNVDGFGCSGTNCDKPENINVPIPRSNTNDIYRVAAYAYDSVTNGSDLKIKINCLGANGLDVIREYELGSLTSEYWWYMSDITWMGSYCVVTDVNPQDIWAE